MLLSPLSYTHQLVEQTVMPGDTVIDATVGNGHDTLLLAKLVGSSGRVIGFDIQKTAVETTQRKLTEAGLESRVDLYHKGHEQIHASLPAREEISLAIYNLGYLPKGDKAIITTPDTTLESIRQALCHLKKHGLVLVMIYYGHEGGELEKQAVMSFAENLPQKEFSVLTYQFINQKNSPPYLVAIEKR